jgi:hypothetical protein
VASLKIGPLAVSASRRAGTLAFKQNSIAAATNRQLI